MCNRGGLVEGKFPSFRLQEQTEDHGILSTLCHCPVTRSDRRA